MGGNLFSTKRISNEELEIVKQDVFETLRGLTMFVPRTFIKKIDHGDLDICLEFPKIKTDKLKDLFNLTDGEININGSVISFQYKKYFQIDLCFFDSSELQSAINYMCFSDLSNMIGVIANKAFAMRYTHKGLVLPIKLKREDILGEVTISNDTQKIMEFFDLDFDKWQTGFIDEVDAFEWIIQSKYFNQNFFEFNALNHKNRTRNLKRKMFCNFVKWHNGKCFINNHIPTENNMEHMWRSLLYFGCDWFEDVKILLEKRRINLYAHSLFNAQDIIEMTNLMGENLGAAISGFKKHLIMDDLTYAKYIVECGKVSMRKQFNDWFNEN